MSKRRDEWRPVKKPPPTHEKERLQTVRSAVLVWEICFSKGKPWHGAEMGWW
jgi:hypothetical protein